MSQTRRSPGRVSGRDVARTAGVSLNTVSLVVRNSPLVAPDTRARVQTVIDRLGYQPNAAAASLASARAHTLGYLVQGGHKGPAEIEAVIDVFGNQLLNAIIERAAEAKYHVLTAYSSTSTALLRSGRIDGVLCNWLIGDEVLVELAASKAPAVLVGRDAGNVPISWVKADEEAGSYAAARHLISLGHRHVGLVGVDAANDNCITQERVRGLRRALEEAHLPLDASAVATGDWSFESGVAMGQVLLNRQPRPTALFVLTEILSAGVLKVAASLNLRVPGDVSIVTVEDSPLVDYLSPRLTAVHVPMYEVGLRATELLLAQLEDTSLPPRRLVLPVTLIVRESSAAPANRADDPLPVASTLASPPQITVLLDSDVAEGGVIGRG